MNSLKQLNVDLFTSQDCKIVFHVIPRQQAFVDGGNDGDDGEDDEDEVVEWRVVMMRLRINQGVPLTGGVASLMKPRPFLLKLSPER